ncbi:helicase [Rubrobacter xylanophilus]|uniref:Helicase n=1 Tax=Rubrobacter xylanophilus TaxID=49319 RepID=A0A510HH49_9ACTN|nr:helicase-related protein [Rubrobacter xylanophilus]BBL79300.1 helicase [Rubrobacter xylanophilus]
MIFKPEVVTNKKGETVAKALAGYWQGLLGAMKEPPKLAISTAYFNLGGFNLLADQLEQAAHVRLMLGAEPDVAEDLSRLRHLTGDHLPEEDGRIRLAEALKEHHRLMEEDRNLIAFSRKADEQISRMIAWLRSERVEVRLLKGRFLHGKAFIVETNHDGVLAGSSNFTYAGLARNIELNLGQYQPSVVKEVMDWYEDNWDAAQPFDLAGLYEKRFGEYDPYVIYLKMLWERYKNELGREESPPGLDLTGFQRDGLYRAMDYLRRNNGVLIADGVGLGKTYLAGELIRQATQDRRQRVLLIAPAALRDGPWKQFLDEYFLGGVQVVSFQELAGEPALGGTGKRVLRHHPNDYAMVVIDEAHAYRNPETNRAKTLRQLLAGSPPKQVVLLTATPVNNSLWDLYYLLSYFIRNDAAFLEAGIPSLRKHFKEANAEDPDNLSPDKLFDVLDAVAVRRTRRFVKRFYPNERIKRGDTEITIAFPQPTVLRESYELDDLLRDFFPRFAHALGADVKAADSPLPSPEDFDYGKQLTLARYAPSAYRTDGEPDAFELQAAGLLSSGLLKRFESSAHAFARTCRKMACSHTRFLEALEKGWVLTSDALAAWNRTDSDEFDPEAIAGGRRDHASNYDVQKLREAVRADRELLEGFAAEAEQVSNESDPKLNALVEALVKIAKEAKDEAVSKDDERNKRKVIIFSYYADTVEWIKKRLEKECAEDPRLAPYRDRLATVTGSSVGSEDVLFGFAPVSSQAPAGRNEDKYDLLIATDVLAEGVNLQQARHIINFDLPWNPMRLVQRHGRIDRIGSPHSRVYLRCFFPSKDLDALLGLEATLQRKITQAAKSIGVEGEIVPGSKSSDQVFAHTKEQIEALFREDATLFEQAEDTGTLSGEEFRRELANALNDTHWRNSVKDLPWVAGSGKISEGPGGFVFCARVGDHPRPQYRWVPIAEDGASIQAEAIVEDTLTCLGKAVCSPETERVLPESIADLAYDAWEAARRHIFERWIEATDPANTQPAIPKPMRDAADLLRTHPPGDLSTDRLHRLLDTIEAPYDTRIQRMMRKALDAHGDVRERVAAVIRLVEDLGLEPPPEVEPLPEIEKEDVNLVAWMALVPGDNGA